MSEELYVYNTLNRKKEKFEPLAPGFVGIYVCGPTVYDHSHIGHAKSYISFDVIVRYLRYLGYKVRYVQNITDVGHLHGDSDEGEDRIIKKAQVEKLEPMEIAEYYARSYFEDMDLLGNVRPDISPRASGHIVEQIEMIKRLIQKDLAYESNGNVYFNVHHFEGYGKLSGRKIEELEAGKRVEVAEGKKHPADFALWKKAMPGHLMHWNSPWGQGYPGWHIECSSMSTKYLGETIDIHGGGLENMFPHHECEIAQSEGAFGRTFARYWLHNNMVTIGDIKMGKSLKNFITIKEAVQNHEPLAIRYFILMSHYRSTLDFSDKALDAATAGYRKLKTAIQRFRQSAESANNSKIPKCLPIKEYEIKFRAAMNDDFNTPQAIAAFFELSNEANRILDKNPGGVSALELKDLDDILRKTIGDVLGIYPQSKEDSAMSDTDNKQLVNILLDIRSEMRRQKNFAMADEIRNKLESIGIIIKDTPDGSSWEKIKGGQKK